VRDGDLDLYDMNVDGSQPRRLTSELGYDGGAFHSQDSQWIVYRASRPRTPEEVKQYKDLLAQNLVMPAKLEIMIMRADGSQKRQLTSNGAANFAPYFHPNGRQIIFASNVNNPDPRSPNFDLYVINRDGTGLRQVTFDEGFDGFPMFRTMERNWSGHQTETQKAKAKPTSLLQTGSNKKDKNCYADF
jgi:Tol biopolymer transport system component